MLREALGLLGAAVECGTEMRARLGAPTDQGADARLGIRTGTGAQLGLAHGRRLKVEARAARHTERQAKLLAGRAAVS